MELWFVINAVRRYWWIPVLAALLGVLVPVGLTSTGSTRFESESIMLISPPSESQVQVDFTNDPDRYVIGQLAVLESRTLAERVANEVGGGETADSIEESVVIDHIPRTDIVHVTATTSDPDRSRLISSTMVSAYFELLDDQVGDTRQPEIDLINADIASLEKELDGVDASIAAAIAPYLPTADNNGSPIPALEQVAPQLVSRRQILLNEIDQLLATRTELAQLELNAKLRVTSRVVQEATLPTEETVPPLVRYSVAGALLGSFVGLLISVLVARLSRRALDESQVSEALGVPTAGEFPSWRDLAKHRRHAVERLPEQVAAFVEEIAVRTEAHAVAGATLTVAVVGVERSSGTTTLAASLANRYAAAGSQVLLIDADARDSELTRLFASGSPGIAALLGDPEADSATRRDRTHSRSNPFSPTSVAGLSVIGIGDKSQRGAVRRQNVNEIIGSASRHAHVVVIDGGPLFDSGATVHLANAVDVVVLAIPNRRLFTRALANVAAQLDRRRGALLPVLMPAARADRKRTNSDGHLAVVEVETPIVEIDRQPLEASVSRHNDMG